MSFWNLPVRLIPRNWISRLCWTLILLVIMSLVFLSLFSRVPDHLGVHDGRLAPCPATPNCVCTQAEDAEHHIEPVTFLGSRADAISRLKRIVLSFPRSKVIVESDDYLHFEFRSALFRFVDDVEFLIDEESKRIHFRSASRVGHGDLGVNRHRMNLIREAWKGMPHS